MKIRNQLFLLLIVSGALAGCAAVTSTGEVARTPGTSQPPATVHVDSAATSAGTTASAAPYCEDSRMWRRVWLHDDRYGQPFAVRVGPQSDFWFLYRDGVVHYRAEDDFMYIPFTGIPGCSRCEEGTNGTIAITPDGDAWIGFADGVAVVEAEGTTQYTQPPWTSLAGAEDVQPFVLAADAAGRVWTSNASGSLCALERGQWDCAQLGDMPTMMPGQVLDVGEIGYVASAIVDMAGDLWLGTSLGWILHYSEGELAGERVRDRFPELSPIYTIGALSIDARSGTIWAVETTPPSCGEGILQDTAGIFSRTSDGVWRAFPKSLFATSGDDRCFGVFSSIAVVREGIVWAGMKYRHGLAFYDGRDWRTLSGAVLPAVHNHEYSSCDFVMDITATRTGSLLVLNPIGVFEYTGVDS